jgi:hypothetical protein
MRIQGKVRTVSLSEYQEDVACGIIHVIVPKIVREIIAPEHELKNEEPKTKAAV